MKPACKVVNFFLEITHFTWFLINLFITGGAFFLIEREIPFFFVPLYVTGILFSWAMMHTIYVFHHAHYITTERKLKANDLREV